MSLKAVSMPEKVPFPPKKAQEMIESFALRRKEGNMIFRFKIVRQEGGISLFCSSFSPMNSPCDAILPACLAWVPRSYRIAKKKRSLVNAFGIQKRERKSGI
eukprot:1385047-Amorphochlora_amoeboformis.AAC.1